MLKSGDYMYYINDYGNTNTAEITKYAGSSNSVNIPDIIGKTPVTRIGANAFNGSSVTNVNIPESVKYIDDYAFANCTGLTDITIPDVEYIGGYAFTGCTSLTDVTLHIGEGCFIGWSAFSNCTWLTSVTIEPGGGLPGHIYYTNIGRGTFENCTRLKNLVIGYSDKFNFVINTGAFKNCGSLTSITLPDNVTTIENGAFEDCTGLTSVTYKGESYNYQNINELYKKAGF